MPNRMPGRSFRWMPMIAGISLLLSPAPALRADDSAPRNRPDVKAWKSDREAGQKALEDKNAAAAEKYFKDALAEAENFDPDDYRLAESLTDLGLLYARTGNFAAAEPLMKRAVVVRKGDPHPELESRCNLILGIICRKLGHYQDSEQAFLRAEEVLSHRVRPGHPKMVSLEYQRALLYAEEGDFSKAEPLLKHCVELFENPISETYARKGDPATYGIETFIYNYKPNYAAALEGLSRLSALYLQQHRTADAEACMKESLKLVDEYASRNDPYLVTTLKELANYYFTTTNYTAAEPVTKRLVAIEEKRRGPADASTLSAQAALAAVYLNEKKADQATALYEQILPLDDRTFGPDQRISMDIVERLSAIYLELGRYDKAEPLYRRRVEHAEKSNTSEVEIIGLLNTQENIYSRLGRNDDLVKVCQREIGTFEKMFGPQSPALIKPLSDCAEALRKMNRDAEAEPLEARVHAIREAQPK